MSLSYERHRNFMLVSLYGVHGKQIQLSIGSTGDPALCVFHVFSSLVLSRPAKVVESSLLEQHSNIQEARTWDKFWTNQLVAEGNLADCFMNFVLDFLIPHVIIGNIYCKVHYDGCLVTHVKSGQS